MKTKNCKPRLCMVLATFPTLSENFIINKFIGLLERGWDVNIVCNHSDIAEWDRLEEFAKNKKIKKRVQITWPHRPRWLAAMLTPITLFLGLFFNPYITIRYLYRGWIKFGIGILRLFYLDFTIIKYHPDVIHFEFGSLSVKRMYLKELLNAKITVSFRGYDLNYVGLEDPNYYQNVWNQADALHLLGEDLWKRAQRRGCPADKKHALIPPAIDAQFFDPWLKDSKDLVGTKERPVHILSVGRLEWKKGYEYAIQAVKGLIAQGIYCQYHIIGEGSYYEAIVFTRYDLELENVIVLLGTQAKEQVKSYLQWADIFLHTAVSEGFCNSVLEAQAMQVPVVCSDADGLKENVLDDVTGFVVPRRDPVSLTQKMMLLLSSNDLRRKMGEAGRIRILSQFALPNQIKQFEEFYSSLNANTKSSTNIT